MGSVLSRFSAHSLGSSSHSLQRFWRLPAPIRSWRPVCALSRPDSSPLESSAFRCCAWGWTNAINLNFSLLTMIRSLRPLPSRIPVLLSNNDLTIIALREDIYVVIRDDRATMKCLFCHTHTGRERPFLFLLNDEGVLRLLRTDILSRLHRCAQKLSSIRYLISHPGHQSPNEVLLVERALKSLISATSNLGINVNRKVAVSVRASATVLKRSVFEPFKEIWTCAAMYSVMKENRICGREVGR